MTRLLPTTIRTYDVDTETEDHAIFPTKQINGKNILIISKKSFEVVYQDDDMIIMKEKGSSQA